jgi:hypothetical protein
VLLKRPDGCKLYRNFSTQWRVRTEVHVVRTVWRVVRTYGTVVRWASGRDGRSSGLLTGNRNLHSAKSSESALNNEIPVYSIFTHTSDFVQTQNEAKKLTDSTSFLIIYQV